MTINDFIKGVKELFGHVEYKATSKDGRVFKTRGYDNREKDISRNGGKSDRCDFFNSKSKS